MQWAVTHADVPEPKADQREQSDNGLREVAPEQGQQAIVLGVVDQRDVGVGAQIPEQPGVVVLADGLVLPQLGVGDHGDRAQAVGQLHHVRGLGAVGPRLRQILRVVEVEVGVEASVGRCVFVFQIESGQLREALWFSVCG
ncbi:hypothetical protein D3C81_1837880 [compost metagenome]